VLQVCDFIVCFVCVGATAAASSVPVAPSIPIAPSPTTSGGGGGIPAAPPVMAGVPEAPAVSAGGVPPPPPVAISPGGPVLSKATAAPPAAAAAADAGGDRGDLLAAIRAGKKLKKVTEVHDASGPTVEPGASVGGGGAALVVPPKDRPRTGSVGGMPMGGGGGLSLQEQLAARLKQVCSSACTSD